MSETAEALAFVKRIQDEGVVQVYPCGSRFFGTATDISDYDFFTEHPLSLFTAQGFTEGTYYEKDKNTLGVCQRGKVQVIQVRNADARLALQKLILEEKLTHRVKDTDFWMELYAKHYPNL